MFSLSGITTYLKQEPLLLSIIRLEKELIFKTPPNPQDNFCHKVYNMPSLPSPKLKQLATKHGELERASVVAQMNKLYLCFA